MLLLQRSTDAAAEASLLWWIIPCSTRSLYPPTHTVVNPRLQNGLRRLFSRLPAAPALPSRDHMTSRHVTCSFSRYVTPLCGRRNRPQCGSCSSVRLSVCLSVSQLWTKRRRKTKLAWTSPSSGLTGSTIFCSESQKLGARFAENLTIILRQFSHLRSS